MHLYPILSELSYGNFYIPTWSYHDKLIMLGLPSMEGLVTCGGNIILLISITTWRKHSVGAGEALSLFCGSQMGYINFPENDAIKLEWTSVYQVLRTKFYIIPMDSTVIDTNLLWNLWIVLQIVLLLPGQICWLWTRLALL